jgi:hypothetical protein
MDELAREADSAEAQAKVAAVPLLPQPLLPKAPARWKAPVGKLMATKAIVGTALPDDRKAAEEAKAKKNEDVMVRWYVGYIYAFFGLFDISARVVGVILWKIRFDTTSTPRVSDTQRFEVEGKVVYTLDLWRLVIVGAAAVIRCAVNLLVLWPVFAHLRPSWMVRGAGTNRKLLMRLLVPVFRALLVLWCLSDFLQACTPDIPNDPTEHRILTPHIMFHQFAWISCGLTNLLLFVVLFHDRDAGDVFVVAGFFTLAITISSFIYYDVTLFRCEAGKSTPMGWALVVETSALMCNAGMALPTQILAVPGLGKRVKFIRHGKVRPGEDTSARTGLKPLLTSKEDHGIMCIPKPEWSDSDGDPAKTKESSSSSPEDDFIKRQREELAQLNATIRTKTGGYGKGRKAASDAKEKVQEEAATTEALPSTAAIASSSAPSHDPYAP